MNETPLPEQAEATRRGFLKFVIGALALLNGLIAGIPFLKTLITPARRKKAEWYKVADVNSLPGGRPKHLNFMEETEDAYHSETALQSVWVIRYDASKLTVYSPVCTHLGCHFIWNQETGRFECPCHASVFSIDGKVLSGPAPRPLDTLQYKVENGAVFIRWERFKSGIPEKVSIA